MSSDGAGNCGKAVCAPGESRKRVEEKKGESVDVSKRLVKKGVGGEGGTVVGGGFGGFDTCPR